MFASSTVFIAMASGISLLINLGVLIAFLVVVLTVVRRERPDAVALLLGALVSELLLTCLSYAVSLILPQLIGAMGGVAGYAQAQAVNILVFALAHAAARGLLLWGVVRLARPAEQPN